MDPTLFLALALNCAPQVQADTVRALVQVESAFNPWAIGVVGGSLLRQPRQQAEAVVTAQALHATGWNFSVGLGQINVGNFPRLGLNLATAFEPCANLRAMQAVLTDCFDQASRRRPGSKQAALQRALSCYYSGNFTTGLREGYVSRVMAAVASPSPGAPPLPSPPPTFLPPPQHQESP